MAGRPDDREGKLKKKGFVRPEALHVVDKP